MQWLLRKCTKCGRYTFNKDRCPVCGAPVKVPHPPRFSPEDKYVEYRYKMKLIAGLIKESGKEASKKA
ncbi:MAG: RNA-protein complex protein Nop10 [Pyrodictiaceae archaeon]